MGPHTEPVLSHSKRNICSGLVSIKIPNYKEPTCQVQDSLNENSTNYITSLNWQIETTFLHLPKKKKTCKACWCIACWHNTIWLLKCGFYMIKVIKSYSQVCDILVLMALEFLCVVHMRKYSEEHFNLFLSMKYPMKVKGVKGVNPPPQKTKKKRDHFKFHYRKKKHQEIFSVLFPKRKKSNRFRITKRVSL